jgi:hypothetical protein
MPPAKLPTIEFRAISTELKFARMPRLPLPEISESLIVQSATTLR